MALLTYSNTLVFQKGKIKRPLAGAYKRKTIHCLEAKSIQALKEDYCLRENCISKRRRK
jgi:hypothetical protein